MRKTTVVDPLRLAAVLWPTVRFYGKQRDIIYSVAENADTVVVAGNMLGKDYVAGFIALHFFLTRSPCRIVTTSADHSQLEAVLWGEIRRFMSESVVPLDANRGGPIVANHLHLKKARQRGKAKDVPWFPDGSYRGERRKGQAWIKDEESGYDVCGISYCIGRVAAKGEGMLGHHVAETGDGIPRTLFIADEASGVDDTSWDRADTWAKRRLAIGNPYPPKNGANFFYNAVKEGDLQEKPEEEEMKSNEEGII